MSVHDFLAIISIFADIALIALSGSKLHRMSEDYDNRPVVMGLIVGFAMLIMHLTGFADKSSANHSLRVMCWQLLQLITEVTMIKLVISIPSKK
ncbi:MAG: hypothetical protein ACRDC5_06075 [Vibrio sp.]